MKKIKKKYDELEKELIQFKRGTADNDSSAVFCFLEFIRLFSQVLKLYIIVVISTLFIIMKLLLHVILDLFTSKKEKERGKRR